MSPRDVFYFKREEAQARPASSGRSRAAPPQNGAPGAESGWDTGRSSVPSTKTVGGRVQVGEGCGEGVKVVSAGGWVAVGMGGAAVGVAVRARKVYPLPDCSTRPGMVYEM